jgi:alkylation response protein AidB-like acyl-CoA dehydrogenase
VARILRDAQINTLWEGPDNILCLDVRRAMRRENADKPFMARIQEAIANAGEAIPSARVVAERAKDLQSAIEAWGELEGEIQEARLFPLAQFMAEVFAAAVLTERAEWELREFGDDRKSLVASLYVEKYLMDAGPMRGIGAPTNQALDRFDELLAGALVDGRLR